MSRLVFWGFGLIFTIEAVYFRFITEVNTQESFQEAAKGGLGSILLLLFTSAVLGPIGEELVFRGVVQSALEKYGSLAALVGSSLIFAAVHGPSVIFVDAFVMGLSSARYFACQAPYGQRLHFTSSTTGST